MAPLRNLLLQAEAEPPVDASQSVAEGARSMARAVLEQLPQVLAGLVVLLVFVALAVGVRALLRRSLLRATHRSESFANVLSNVARALVLLAGFAVALTVAFPGVNVGTLVAGLGLGSVALGFAFSDILQNMLAGLLLLLRQPFAVGDEIEVGEHRGEVEAITIRETRLRTYDGRRVLIPNADVYTSSVTVHTAFDSVRMTLVIGVDYDDDLAQARQVALRAAAGVDGVLDEPAPQGYYRELGDSSIELDLRYWVRAGRAQERAAQDRVVEAVKREFDAAGLSLPFMVVELDARDGYAAAVGG